MKKKAPDTQTLSEPLGRGGTPRPDIPTTQSALARRDKGMETEYDKSKTLKGPLGR